MHFIETDLVIFFLFSRIGSCQPVIRNRVLANLGYKALYLERRKFLKLILNEYFKYF